MSIPNSEAVATVAAADPAEYGDPGVYLGAPDDPEDQAEALRQLEATGPLMCMLNGEEE
jgi:hypothetical protein